VSISGDNISGRWIRARPKYDALKFTNDHFSAAMAYRLHHRQPSFIQRSKCNCKKTPLLDELGHHISTACGQGGHRIMTHDSVKFCIKDLLNSCGIKSRVEVAECFRVANPENNQRPDLMLYNALDFNKPVVADVCITCSIPSIPVAASAPLSLSAARKPGRAAQIARTVKETKYKAACDVNGLELLPIRIESTLVVAGARRVMDFFRKVLKANSKGNELVYRAYSNYRLFLLQLQ
jgi:hypothetical protein